MPPWSEPSEEESLADAEESSQTQAPPNKPMFLMKLGTTKCTSHEILGGAPRAKESIHNFCSAVQRHKYPTPGLSRSHLRHVCVHLSGGCSWQPDLQAKIPQVPGLSGLAAGDSAISGRLAALILRLCLRFGEFRPPRK